jgi:hypothetical protein
MRTFNIPFSFVSSPETEKERLLYTSGMVADGFYSRHEYLITPSPIDRFKEKCIVLPELIKNVSQEFWREATWGGQFMPKKITERMWNETKDINLSPVNLKIINKFKDEWRKIESETWKAIAPYFPNEIKWVKSLEVRITKIGSLGSHYLLDKKGGQNLIINIREDSNAKEIVNLLILALTYPQADDLNLSFTKRLAVRNFILSRPAFKKIYPDFKIFDKKIPVSLKRKSDEYIKYMGIPNLIDPITQINKNLAIFGIKEGKLLKEMIDKRGEIVTYDDIADLIWGEGRFKSYWAINKLVQRIQKKIDSLNILLKIDGVRGIGYILNDF